MACRTQSCPAAYGDTRTLGVAGPQWVHTSEYRGEYDVPVQAVVRGTALGAGLESQRTEAMVKCSVLNRMTRLEMPETVRLG
jgi:hypothetical protein